jgi:hypothetical protein
MNKLLEHLKFCFKVIFQDWKLVKMFLKISIFKVFYFLKMCPIQNFGRSDGDVIYWKNAHYRCMHTLESGIDVGQGITVGSGKLVKKNKCRAWNNHRAWTKCANLCYKKPIKLENICRPCEKFQNLINVGPLIRM